MSRVLLDGIDRDEFSRQIAAEVVVAIEHRLHRSDGPQLVDRQRMSELLSVSLPTLDRMVAAGEVPSILVGTRRLFEPRKVIDALAVRNRETAGA